VVPPPADRPAGRPRGAEPAGRPRGAEPAARPAGAPLVLLAEHEPDVAELARRYLARAGLLVAVAGTAAETLAALSAASPPACAAAVIDLTMPGLDARRLRRLLAEPCPGPAGRAVATGRAVYLIGSGVRPRDVRVSAERCLHRPFSPRLLVSRVLAAAGAAAAPQPPPVPAISATLALDPETSRVRIGGRDVPLTPAEFALLAALARHAGRVLTRDQLQAAMRRSSSGRAVDVHVAQLRAKLPAPAPIRTVRGVGYVFDEPAGGRPGGHRGPPDGTMRGASR